MPRYGLDGLASQSEYFIGLFSFRRAKYEDFGFFDVYFIYQGP